MEVHICDLLLLSRFMSFSFNKFVKSACIPIGCLCFRYFSRVISTQLFCMVSSELWVIYRPISCCEVYVIWIYSVKLWVKHLMSPSNGASISKANILVIASSMSLVAERCSRMCTDDFRFVGLLALHRFSHILEMIWWCMLVDGHYACLVGIAFSVPQTCLA